MFEFEEIKKHLKRGKNPQEVFKNFDWRSFEQTISEIFRTNDFAVRQNFRFKTARRYEIDVLAIRGRIVVCADCKDWSMGRYKVFGLRQAAAKQEDRVAELRKFLKGNYIAQKLLNVKSNFYFLPLLVTLVEENLTQENKTCVVPLEKLNTLLLEIENYI